MSDPVLQFIPLERIHPNPFQVQGDRRLHGPDFDDLVESIRVDGLHQPPPARFHPALQNAYQLQMGHRRFAAFRLARPDECFPLLVKDLSDLEMFIGVVEENLHRSDLNDIERAQMVEQYKKLQPDATNAEMARVFRLKDPASISNLRKLLKLPAPIQQLVAENKLPDQYARQLVGIHAIKPATALKVAQEVAKAPRSEKEAVFEGLTRSLFWNELLDLRNDHWSLDWLADAPLVVEADLGEGDHLLGPCTGCPFNVSDHCARKACFDEKFRRYAALQTEERSQQKKIPVAAAGEEITILFAQENYGDDDKAKRLLTARKEVRATLRLLPRTDRKERSHYLAGVLGSRFVRLGTTDEALCAAFIAEEWNKSSRASTRAAREEKPADETDAQREKRVAQEKKEQAANRAARSRMWKSYHDALWLLEHAARLIGEDLSLENTNKEFAKFLEEVVCENHRALEGAYEIEQRIEKEMKAESNAGVQHTLRFVHMVLNVMAEEAVRSFFHSKENEREVDYEGAHDSAEETAELFGVALPDSWDIPPVHRTAFNCWHCGVFAGNTQEKLTKRDVDEDGWIDLGKEGVFCSEEHRQLYQAQSPAHAQFLKRSQTATKARAKTKAAKGKK